MLSNHGQLVILAHVQSHKASVHAPVERDLQSQGPRVSRSHMHTDSRVPRDTRNHNTLRNEMTEACEREKKIKPTLGADNLSLKQEQLVDGSLISYG